VCDDRKRIGEEKVGQRPTHSPSSVIRVSYPASTVHLPLKKKMFEMIKQSCSAYTVKFTKYALAIC